jgi:chemotaxis protein CheD
MVLKYQVKVELMEIEQTETKEISVGMGRFEVAHNPHILVALGLGSCIGVALYDERAKIGALAHIMLGCSTKFANQTDLDRFADVSIPRMVQEMVKLGAKKEQIWAKIAGGSEMFPDIDDPEIKVSDENINSVKATLIKENIPLIGEDTGGNFGRTVKLHTINGDFEIIVKMRERSYFL